jgi:hypothetical protein
MAPSRGQALHAPKQPLAAPRKQQPGIRRNLTPTSVLGRTANTNGSRRGNMDYATYDVYKALPGVEEPYSKEGKC